MRTTTIIRPERVAVVRPGMPHEMLDSVKALTVIGGLRMPPDNRVSFGFHEPVAIGAVLRDGGKRRIDRAQAVLVRGGRLAPEVVGGGGNTGHLAIEDTDVGLGQIINFKQASPWIDEVDHYLQQKARARTQVGGDDFRVFQQMNNNAKTDAHDEAAFVRNNPSSIMGAFLGKAIPNVSVSTTPGQGAGYGQGLPNPGYDLPTAITNAQSVASWSAPDEQVSSVVCTFGQFGNSNIPAGSSSFRPFGVVQWGVNGLLSAAIVDIGRGTMFSVAASSVMLSVGMESLPQQALPIPGPNSILSLGGFLAFHLINRGGAPVTRTIYSDTQFSATPTIIFVPPFAKRVSLMIAGNGTALTANICDSNSDFTGAPAHGMFLLASGQTQVLNVPLPGDATAISVATTAGPNVDGCLVFELGLG